MILKIIKSTPSLAIIAVLSVFLLSPMVNANDDRASIQSETTFYDLGCVDTGSATGNSTVYAIGDSVLERAKSSGELVKKLTAKKYSKITIDAIIGRSITGEGQTTGTSPPSSALESARKSTDLISSAGTILIVLGTNPDNYNANIPKFMKIIRGANKNARVFWVNVGTTLGRLNDNTQSANSAIEKFAEEYSYKVIDWRSEVGKNKSLVNEDGYHPNIPAGVNKLVNLVVDSLGEFSGSGTPGNPAPVKGSEQEKNAAIVWNYLTNKGLTAEQVAGFLGNIQGESGIMPNLQEYGTGIGYGLVQWSYDRRTKLENFAKAKGKSVSDINLQLDFLWHELTGEYDHVLKGLKETKTIKAATVLILLKYEKPENQSLEVQNQRTEFAEKWFKKFSGFAGSDSGTDECVSDSGLGVSADGFVFPQKTTQKKLKDTEGNSHWMDCENPRSRMEGGILKGSCHHHYLAADLMNDTGTVVVAPRPGIIISSHDSGIYGYTIRLYSDKKLGGDGNYYYFAHNLSGSSKVSVNDKVEAGDVLAKVGTSEDAEGTPPHTHFDISPVENGFSRGSSGSEGPLLDPNPVLRAAFKNLPER
jgi:murein DD-endopeptidase MepM/ murein hydrolase activator NlpD